jgi:F-type H+-transporting ATPase subunit b
MANHHAAGEPRDLSHVTEAEGLPETGGKALTTEHVEVGGHHAPEPAFMGLNATVWVSLAMLALLIILAVRKVPAMIGGLLDKQIAAIRQRLDEAKQLRAEAEALRDEYARKLADVETQTRDIVAHAEAEAAALVAKAESDAADLVQRRARMAEDKIAAAERTALAEVRARAADAATTAAAALIAGKHDAGADAPLIDRTIAGLGRPN